MDPRWMASRGAFPGWIFLYTVHFPWAHGRVKLACCACMSAFWTCGAPRTLSSTVQPQERNSNATNMKRTSVTTM